MKVAIIGSRNISGDCYKKLCENIPCNASEIISGGARGIDTLAARYAKENGLALREFLPDYEKYKKRAPLVRNEQIISSAKLVIAFWDGKSRGTAHSIATCVERGVPVKVIRV